MSALDEFMEFIWSDTAGYVYLPTLDRKSGVFKRNFFEWPKHRKAIANHVAVSAAEGREVYYGPAIYKSLPEKNKNESKEHILGAHVLWVDFDGNAPESWDNEPSGTLSARPEDQTRTPPPSLRIQSSDESHQHVYWKLDQLVTDLDVLEEKNRALAYLLKADTSGWDANQILRPPESVNFKRDLPVTVAEETGDKFPLERFSYLRPAKEIIKYDELILDAVVPIEPVMAKYTWPQQFTDLFFSDVSALKIDRSASLSQVAYFGAELGMTDAEIFSLLVDADSRWGKFVKRKDRQRRLSELVNRARLKHPTAVTDISVSIGSGAVVTEVDTKYIYDFREFVETEFSFDWLIPDVISRTGSAIVASAPGVGKTQFCIRLAMALAVGRKFLHWTPVRQARTLFISLEMGGPALQQFMGKMAVSETPDTMNLLAENFFVVPLGQPIPLDKPAGMDFLVKMMEEYKPDMLVIDSFGQLFSGKLTDDDGIRKIHGDLANLRVRFDCGMVFIHHNRKADSNNKKPVELGDIFGSQYITSAVDYVASLWRNEEEGCIEYREVKARLSAQKPLTKYRRTEDLNFELITSSAGDSDAEGNPVGKDWTDDSSAGDAGSGSGVFNLG